MIKARGGIGKARNGKMNPAGEQETAWSGGNGGFCLGFSGQGWRLAFLRGGSEESRFPSAPSLHNNTG